MEVELERDLTVLVGSNAGGKTAMLDALSILLSAYVGAFDTGRGPGFRRSDAHVRTVGTAQTQEAQYPVSVLGWLHAPREPVRVRRELRGESGRTTTGEASPLRHLAKDLQAAVRAGEEPSLPIVAYYGTGRTWRTLPLRRTKVSRSRLAGYKECLESQPAYREMASWMRWATLVELQDRNRSESSNPLAGAVLRNIGEAASQVLQVESDEPEQVVRCNDVRYDFEDEEIVADLRLADRPAVKLPVSSLSDGLRSVLGVVVDMAFRMAVLNPHLGPSARLKTSGIVMIDEVDLHLHPRWQQQILPQIQRAFPAIQLIVTTHSPQVLSTVDGRTIRQLDAADSQGGRVTGGQKFTRGHESGELLWRVQSVPERPPSEGVTSQLREYFTLIDDGHGDSEQAKELRQQLDEQLGGPEFEPDLLRAEHALRIARLNRR